MKKILALALAASVVASYGTTAFAAHTIGLDESVLMTPPQGYLEDKDGKVAESGGTVPYGDTIYYPLVGAAINPADGAIDSARTGGSGAGDPKELTHVFTLSASTDTGAWESAPIGASPNGTNSNYTGNNAQLVFESDAVDGLKLKADWDMGKDLVEGVDIVKKRVLDGDATSSPLSYSGGPTQIALNNGVQSYAYFVAIELKENATETDEDFVSGTIEFNKKPGESKIKAVGATTATTGPTYVYDTNAGAPTAATMYKIGDNIEFKEIDDKDIEISFDVVFDDSELDTSTDTNRVYYFSDEEGEDDYELVIIDDDIAIFIVDTIGQGDLVIAADNDYNAEVSNAHPRANLDFLTMNGATFNKTGELFIFADEEQDNYLYILNEDGTLSESGVDYDDSEEAFVLRTRTLGSYVISDRELDIEEEKEEEKEPEVEAPEVETPAPIVPGGTTVTPGGTITPGGNTQNPNPGTGAKA